MGEYFSNLPGPEAQELLFYFSQRLFMRRMDEVLRTPFDNAYGEEADQALLWLSENLSGDISGFSLGAQRVIYERFVQTIMLLQLRPDTYSPDIVRADMTDGEKLAVLLRHGIVGMSLPFPVQERD